tara:strand:+ start:964 stop:1707 length:744 start_codon:yes stop_codon:yes gene_type:complete
MKKIKLKEEELVNLIQKLVKENLGNGNGTNFGMMGTPTSKYKEMFETEDIEEDSEGEETYNYGEDEGEDKKEEKGLEREEDMAPEDRIGEIEKHLDALKKDMGYDEDREDRDEKGERFEGKEGTYMGAPSKTEKRDTYDGKPGEVVGVDSNIKKQRNEGKKAKTLNLTENQLVGIVERMVREQEEEKEKKNVIGKTWEQLSDFARKLFLRNKRFKMCRPKRGGSKTTKCPVWSSMSDADKTKITQEA